MEDEAGTVPETALAVMMRRELLRLAAVEDHLALDQAARTPYWESCPETVIAHRAAARVLRENADRYLVRSPRLRPAH